MIRTRLASLSAILTLSLFWAAGVAVADDTASSFSATLTGDQQVPPVHTSGGATANFVVSGPNQLTFTLQLTSPTTSPITLAHIHLEAAGNNGNVIVNLCGTSDTPACGQSGVVAQGTITSDNFVGHLAGRPMNDLLMFMNEGNTYVNIHTQNFPAGEIRGQLQPSSDGTIHHTTDTTGDQPQQQHGDQPQQEHGDQQQQQQHGDQAQH
jgi:hypothetical protein